MMSQKISDHFSNVTSNIFLISICLLLCGFIAIPLLSIFLNVDIPQVKKQLSNPEVVSALITGLVTALVSTIISMIFAIPTAYLLANRKFPGKTIIDTLLDIPMVLPPAVAGLALLLAFAPRGILGSKLSQLGIILPGSMLAVIMAQTFVASVFTLRSSRMAFEHIDKRLIDNAKLFTNSKLRILLTVTLPLAKNGIIYGVLMTWARSMGEFGATILFAGNLPGVTQTMPLAIYTLMSEDIFASNTLSVILITVSFTVLIIFKSFNRGEVMES
ncbi:MAG: molybdate transport system permease protein [Thermoproteota archaeon]|nr:molybdate transport system permease protein [Thermoproteota archaeon]